MWFRGDEMFELERSSFSIDQCTVQIETSDAHSCSMKKLSAFAREEG
jgi:hypothetical protein